MEFTIRPAGREDCPAMLELIRELAAYERAPDEVTVSLAHFEESGFGDQPVWWAFVACTDGAQAAAAVAEEAAALPSVAVQDPMLANLISGAAMASQDEAAPVLPPPAASLQTEPGMQLEEAVIPLIPEPVQEALPLMQPAPACGHIVGFALYYIRYSTWKGRRMFLEDIIVTEGWRGRGVGTALMDTLFGAARAGGFHGISWQVLSWNEPAIRFYERYGVRFDHEWLNAAVDFMPLP